MRRGRCRSCGAPGDHEPGDNCCAACSHEPAPPPDRGDKTFIRLDIGHFTHRLPYEVVMISAMPYEWPISIVYTTSDGGTTQEQYEERLAKDVEREIQRRLTSDNIKSRGRDSLKVFRCQIGSIEEIYVEPPRTLAPTMRPKSEGT